MIALIVEVGRRFGVLVAAESCTHDTALIKDSTLCLCLGQDVVGEV